MAALTQVPNFCLPLDLVHPLGVSVVRFEATTGFVASSPTSRSKNVPPSRLLPRLELYVACASGESLPTGLCGPLGSAAAHLQMQQGPPGFALTVIHSQ